MPVCFTRFCPKALCQYTPLLNLRSIVFGSRPWLPPITITTDSDWNAIYNLCLFYFRSLFSGTQLERKTRGWVCVSVSDAGNVKNWTSHKYSIDDI